MEYENAKQIVLCHFQYSCSFPSELKFNYQTAMKLHNKFQKSMKMKQNVLLQFLLTLANIMPGTLKQPWQQWMSHRQYRGGSEAAGKTPGIKVPHSPSHAFCLLVWDAYYVVGTTFNCRLSLGNTFG